jgi:hypothetical protein
MAQQWGNSYHTSDKNPWPILVKPNFYFTSFILGITPFPSPITKVKSLSHERFGFIGIKFLELCFFKRPLNQSWVDLSG